MDSKFRKWIVFTAIAFWATGVGQALDLKIMTFNIRNGSDHADWNNRRAQVFALLKSSAPDIAGMQEVYKYQLDELLAALPGYAALGVGRDDGKTAGEYSPIFYRTALFKVDTSATFWLSETPEIAGSKVPGAGSIRIDTWARLRHIQSGQTFYFHSTHWDNVSVEAQLLGAKLIAQRILDRKYKQDPVLFVCDCNALADEAPVRYMLGDSGSPIAFYDAYLTLHPGVPGSASFNGFKGDTLGQPIDHIMSFDSIPALDARLIRDHIGAQYPSDHYPLMATLRIPDATSGVAPRPRLRKKSGGKAAVAEGIDAAGRLRPAGHGKIEAVLRLIAR